jgi:hypothetical protein
MRRDKLYRIVLRVGAASRSFVEFCVALGIGAQLLHMVQLTLHQLVVLLLLMALRVQPLLRGVVMRRHLRLLEAGKERRLAVTIVRGIRVMLVGLVIGEYFRIRKRRRRLRQLHQLMTLAIVGSWRMMHPQLVRMDRISRARTRALRRLMRVVNHVPTKEIDPCRRTTILMHLYLVFADVHALKSLLMRPCLIVLIDGAMLALTILSLTLLIMTHYALCLILFRHLSDLYILVHLIRIGATLLARTAVFRTWRHYLKILVHGLVQVGRARSLLPRPAQYLYVLHGALQVLQLAATVHVVTAVHGVVRAHPLYYKAVFDHLVHVRLLPMQALLYFVVRLLHQSGMLIEINSRQIIM